MNSISLATILNFGNLILASANVIIGFSLVVYIVTHNFRSPVARAFCALTAFITIIYLVDISLAEVQTIISANIWLRMQWLGIAFIPAAYLHFSVAMLRTTGENTRWRRVLLWVGYAVSLVTVVAAIAGTSLVEYAKLSGTLYHLVAGRFFWMFAVYYLLATILGWINIRTARNRCLTSTSRRRMSYLLLSFVVPSIGVFPYLLIPTAVTSFTSNMVEFVTLFGNLGVALVIIVIAYIVAYQGALQPDRVIKHDLLHYLLRGPLVAILVIIVMLVVPRVENIIGLPREMVLIVAVAAAIVILQLAVNLGKPAIDRLIYRRDRQEIALIQTLENRLITSTDLEQFLENTLISLCDLLQVPSGFVVTIQENSLRLHVFSGPRETAAAFLSNADLPQLLERVQNSRPEEIVENDDFISADGHWLLPLRTTENHTILGLLGISAASAQPEFDPEQLDAAYGYVKRLELALEDKVLQEQVFHVLQQLEVELNRVQEWRSVTSFVSREQPQAAAFEYAPGFGQSVKDALVQMWGGPKLSASPLTSLQVVRARLAQHGNVPSKAIRSILQEAIEKLRPAGERSMTSNEWILYNILDLRFIEGQRIRDVAHRLAMSESDFYRKQRVAIDQVAETLMRMEQASLEQASQEKAHDRNPSAS
ncbi:MAG: histidine kinase N-terminal 7TM domain-containing protein [Anaerolineae bacterium]